ncbi:P-loop containing nucleoside triphosphate hydrolase protein [Cryomyces antarcticus]
MALSVLGKRSRAATDSAGDSTVALTRAKRRAQLVVGNDENENPFVSRSTGKPARHAADDLEMDELALPETTPRGTRAAGTTPAKHGTPGRRLVTPQTKIDALFKVTKPVVATHSDSKITQTATPQTPRHRDALSKKVPITPSHRVAISGKLLTPQTPRTPSTPSNSGLTVYNQARQVFTRSIHPTHLVGRDAEKKELDDFVSARLISKGSGCVYISGPPGTGKSAFVNEVCEKHAGVESIKAAYVNCMSVKVAKDIYGKMLEDFDLDIELMEGDESAAIRSLFLEDYAPGTSYLVTLDEIDHLLDLDLTLLYDLFEWSLQPSSSLVLVGIANALDLTDRFLPRLKARNLKPHLLPFLPYTAAQIASVITTKLKDLLVTQTTIAADFVPFLQPAAIQFCSKKVASQTGDLRKAFDICRRAIDLVEAETREKHESQAAELALQNSPSKTPLVENMNLSSPPVTRSPARTPRRSKSSGTLPHLTNETAPRVSIAHMAKVTSIVFGNGTTARLQSLNLQQKAVLCALSALERKKRGSASHSIFATPSKKDHAAPTAKQLFEAYSGLCKNNNVLHPLTNTEFRDILGSLETLSLVSPVEGRNGSFAVPATPSRGRRKGGFGAGVADERRVASNVGAKELAAALEGVGSGILRSILAGDGLV